MSSAVQSASSLTIPASAPVSGTAAAAKAPSPATPPEPASPITREVSRGADALVYVYRVLDTATGRTLVQIPHQPVDGPGLTLDATV